MRVRACVLFFSGFVEKHAVLIASCLFVRKIFTVFLGDRSAVLERDQFTSAGQVEIFGAARDHHVAIPHNNQVIAKFGAGGKKMASPPDQIFHHRNQILLGFRNRMHMGPNQALYLLVNNRSMLSLSLTMAEVYAEHASPDGFLYVTYASQEVFG